MSEWRLRHRSQRKRLALAIDEERLHGLYFETVMPALHGRSEMFDHPACQPFWDDVCDRNLPVFWAVTSAEPTPDPYMVQLRSLDGYAAPRTCRACSPTGSPTPTSSEAIK